MPNYCSVYGCNSSSDRNKELSFFQYPRDNKLLKVWIIRVSREDFTPTARSYACLYSHVCILLKQILKVLLKNVVCARGRYHVLIYGGRRRMRDNLNVALIK